MEKYQIWAAILSSLIGKTVKLVHYDCIAQKLTMLFHDNSTLRFSDCAFCYDFGMVGKEIRHFKQEMGEFGMIVAFREYGINSETYDYCVLSHEEDMNEGSSRISIAFKDLTLTA